MDFAQNQLARNGANAAKSAAQLLTLLNKIFVLRSPERKETLAIPPVQRRLHRRGWRLKAVGYR